MARTLITLGVIAGALAVAWLYRRYQPATATAPTYSVPARLERWDFAQPNTDWLLAVFTSKTCSTCAAVTKAAESLANDTLAVQEVEYRRHGDLHQRYGVDAVPSGGAGRPDRRGLRLDGRSGHRRRAFGSRRISMGTARFRLMDSLAWGT